MTSLFRRLLRDQNGGTAIEYGLIAALLSVVVVGAVSATGTSLYNLILKVSNAVK